MVSGYWPVVGASLVVGSSDGHVALLVPEDEQDLARHSNAGEVRTYQPTTLERVQSVSEAAAGPLHDLLQDMGLTCARVGYEFGPASEPASYSAMHLFGGSIVTLLRTAAPANALAPADDLLARLAAVKTPAEVGRLRLSCQIAAQAFATGRARLRPGLQETEAAEIFRASLSVIGTARHDVQRAGGFAWCMAGKNSAQARFSYARSRATSIASHEFVLVHCNSNADGYWTDITRTYVLGASGHRHLQLYDAVFAARAAALAAIRPGVRACEVDRAARLIFESRGLGDAFKHSTGHGVGFAAISANACPRLHPKSNDVLQPGMVFNLEPALYFEDWGGLRHCDVIAVTESGAEALTPFQSRLDDLLVTELQEAA
jgi:Xaa-Pro aminopeptidase